ncbi:MAG: type II toxin-antitoxin system RelE/ParE family toxin [Kiritimatiellia bacterium]
MIFLETKVFTGRIVDAMSDDDYAALQGHLARYPDAGAMIPGCGGVRKIRWAGSGRGKRGGSRLIYYWDCGDRILMLYVYQKNERENLTEEQKKAMRKIAEAYRHEQNQFH